MFNIDHQNVNSLFLDGGFQMIVTSLPLCLNDLNIYDEHILIVLKSKSVLKSIKIH